MKKKIKKKVKIVGISLVFVGKKFNSISKTRLAAAAAAVAAAIKMKTLKLKSLKIKKLF